MRILIVRNYPNTLDVDQQSYNIQELGLARALVKKGHTCDIVFWTSGPDEQKVISCGEGKSVTVFYFHAKNILKNGVYPKRLDALAAQYDIIQESEYNQYQSWLYAKRFADSMVLLHGPYYSKFNTRYNLLCAAFDLLFLNRYKKLGTHFIVKSALARDFLIEKGIRPELIDVVYVGVDEDALACPQGEVPEFVQKVQAVEGKVLLYIGRLERRRKSDFLLDVFCRVRQTHSSAKLVIVGDGDPAYLEKFSLHMRELGLERSVIWQKKLEQKYLSHLYRRADLFLLPTEFDIFGMVLLEAMYFSTAVITSVNGGSSALIENGKNGVTLDTFEKDKWVRAALDLLADDTRRSEMADAASRTIHEHFTWNSVCENYLRGYKKKLEAK